MRGPWGRGHSRARRAANKLLIGRAGRLLGEEAVPPFPCEAREVHSAHKVRHRERSCERQKTRFFIGGKKQMPLPTGSQLLKSIWNTPKLKARLRRFFGCKTGHFYALLRGERPCLVDRYCALVDEAKLADPTGQQSRRIAEYPLNYYRMRVDEQAHAQTTADNRRRAISLITEHAEAIAAFNHCDLSQMTDDDLVTAHDEMQDLRHEAREALSEIQAEISRRSALKRAEKLSVSARGKAPLQSGQCDRHSSRAARSLSVRSLG